MHVCEVMPEMQSAWMQTGRGDRCGLQPHQSMRKAPGSPLPLATRQERLLRAGQAEIICFAEAAHLVWR